VVPGEMRLGQSDRTVAKSNQKTKRNVLNCNSNQPSIDRQFQK
jgi:hypothetical protein